jgi:hypothetical protein
MPRSKANARTDMTSANLNPNAQQAVAGGQTSYLNMTFETGRNPNIPGLLDAIETFYGAGKVTLDEDVAARGIYRLRVAA